MSRTKMIAGLVTAAFSATVLAGCGGSDAGSVSSEVAASGPPPEARCVDLWNAADNQSMRGTLSILTTHGSTNYVSVGFAADYPDLCLITASNPGMGAAMQYLEDTSNLYGGGYGAPSQLSSNNLDPSLTSWNASADEHGFIALSA